MHDQVCARDMNNNNRIEYTVVYSIIILFVLPNTPTAGLYTTRLYDLYPHDIYCIRRSRY